MGIYNKSGNFGPKWASVFEMYNWRLAESNSAGLTNVQASDMFIPPALDHEPVVEMGTTSQAVGLLGTRAKKAIRAMSGGSGGSETPSIDVLREKALRSDGLEDGTMKTYLGLFFGMVEDANTNGIEIMSYPEEIDFISTELGILADILLDETKDQIVQRNAQMILDNFEASRVETALVVARANILEDYDLGNRFEAIEESAFYSRFDEFIGWAKLDSFAKYYGISEELHDLLIDQVLWDYYDEVEVADEVTGLIERALADIRNYDPDTVAHRAASWLIEDIRFRRVPQVKAMIDAGRATKTNDSE